MAAMDWNGIPVQPLSGGYSGETFVAGDPTADPDNAAVVRIYSRTPERAAVDASLLRLLHGVVPVPELVELRPAEGDLPPVLITRFCGGVLLDDVLQAPLADAAAEALGIALGRLLGALSGIPQLRLGEFVGADLALASGGMPTDLAEWAQHYRDTGRLASWTDSDWGALQHLVKDAQDTLDEAWAEDARVVLVHSDFNPKNILVDSGSMDVVALLDWEFAHAGSVYTDVGNFTRFERDARVVAPMLSTFVEQAPGQIRSPYERGRAADLWALIELAGGGRVNPVRELAAELLLAQARAGSVDAWPWDGGRVDPRADRRIS
jgi:aminoglycoside phosphotransferase (APT) family kinase protein